MENPDVATSSLLLIGFHHEYLGYLKTASKDSVERLFFSDDGNCSWLSDIKVALTALAIDADRCPNYGPSLILDLNARGLVVESTRVVVKTNNGITGFLQQLRTAGATDIISSNPTLAELIV